jgi:hypothetical protein
MDETTISELSGKVSEENLCEGCYGDSQINGVLDFITESLENEL